MFGITRRVAEEYGYKGAMRKLSLETAKSISKKLYWIPQQCDQLPPLIAFHIFDTAFHGGCPVLWSQKITGTKQDGIMGVATIAAIRSMNPDKFIRHFLSFRLEYLANLPGWKTFGEGWANRIASNLRQD